MIDGAKAKEIGLALDVLPPEKLMAHCKDVAGRIAKRGPIAVAQAKRVIDQGADVSLADACGLERQAFAKLFATADQREGMKAFLEKRAPIFTGT